MPVLCSVEVSTTCSDRRNARCTVFYRRGKVVVGAIVHDRGTGGMSLYNGKHLVDIARRVWEGTGLDQYGSGDYEEIPPGVILKTRPS